MLFSEPPSPPEGPIDVSDIQKTSAVLSWNESAQNGGSPITHYVVEKRESWKSTWGYAERLKAPTTTVKLTHLTEGTEYYVRVKAENKAGLSEPLESDKFVPKSPYGKLLTMAWDRV